MTYIVSGGALNSTHSLNWTNMFIVSFIIYCNCRILQFLPQMFNMSALLVDDALLLQKSSCF